MSYQLRALRNKDQKAELGEFVISIIVEMTIFIRATAFSIPGSWGFFFYQVHFKKFS